MRKRIILAAAGLVVLSLVIMADMGPSHAATSAAGRAYQAALLTAPATAPTTQLCDTDDLAGNCMNAAGCNYNHGTNVIAWPVGNQCNEAQVLYLNTMCGNGFVTTSCPDFGNSSINRQWDGSVLVQFQVFDVNNPVHFSCLGINGKQTGCDDPNGSCGDSSGCTGTVFVAAGCGREFNCPGPYWWLNRYWTHNNGGKQSWLRIPLIFDDPIIIGSKNPQHVEQFFG